MFMVLKRINTMKNKTFALILLTLLHCLHFMASQEELYKDVKIMIPLENGNNLYIQEFKNKIVAKRVFDGLTEYSASKVGPQTSRYASLLLRSADGDVIAGAVIQINQGGYTADACKLYFLWVASSYRHHGLGTAIMHEIEKHAQINNCFEISIDFKNLQEHDSLQPFFARLGFTTNQIPAACIADTTPCMSKVIASDAFDISDYQPTLHDHLIDHDGNAYSVTIENNIAPELKAHYVQWYSTSVATKPYHYFSIFITSPAQEIIAGAIGQIKSTDDGNFCKVDEFWVDESCRGQNLGTIMMDQITSYAQSKTCGSIKLYTLEFLARGFYKKQGFTVAATFPKKANPHSYEYYLLRKNLE
jgi:ribosomal protein S18 acetylase RimI-like enzyme